MGRADLRCRLGIHSWVREHPRDERLGDPNARVCRRCGKKGYSDFRQVPPGGLGGGGTGGSM